MTHENWFTYISRGGLKAFFPLNSGSGYINFICDRQLLESRTLICIMRSGWGDEISKISSDGFFNIIISIIYIAFPRSRVGLVRFKLAIFRYKGD